MNQTGKKLKCVQVSPVAQFLYVTKVIVHLEDVFSFEGVHRGLSSLRLILTFTMKLCGVLRFLSSSVRGLFIIFVIALHP